MPQDHPSLILVHGLRGDSRGLKALAENIERFGIRCHLIDLPGSGKAGKNPPLKNPTLAGYTDWLHNHIIRQDFPEKPIILGHSMGAIITSHYLKKYPGDSHEKAIFLSPIFRRQFNQNISNVNYYALRSSIRLLPASRRKNFMKSNTISFLISHALTYDKTQQKRIDQWHFNNSDSFYSADSLLADCYISMRQQVTIPKNKKILFCVGEHDQLTPVKLTQKYAKQSNNQCKIVPNTGHLLNFEQPEATAKVIANFILQ